MNPSTAFGLVLADELARCGLREVVLAPGSRSTPLALAFWELEQAGRVRLHVRIDERSASFTALGLAKASRRPAAVICTSGTAAANFHPAVIEADESAVALLVLTADRPPELRGTGASQTVDQVKLYGSAVRWYAEAGVPERRVGAVAYWRSLACRAWAQAAGTAGTLPGPVHLNLPLRDPLVPDFPPGADWPESLEGRPGGQPWTRIALSAPAAAPLELPWGERGVVVCGDGDYDAAALTALAQRAGWPVLAEPSSGARQGPNALAGYQYLLASREFMAAHRPEIIIVAGRPGLSRPQSSLLGLADGSAPARHVVIAQGPGMWADQRRAATDVAAAVRLSGVPAPAPGRWLAAWQAAESAATRAAARVLDTGATEPAAAVPAAAESAASAPAPGAYSEKAPASSDKTAAVSGKAAAVSADGLGAAAPGLSEPEIARELTAALAPNALLWCGNSLSVRDVDLFLPARTDVRVMASRGASGIDGTSSTAIGATLAHTRRHPGAVGFALIGDLSLLHDAPGLALGPAEVRPDLLLIVVNNDGGGIFAGLEAARFPGPFERVFTTPHGASIAALAAAFGIRYELASQPGDIAKAAAAMAPGSGLRIVEARTSQAGNARLRDAMHAAAAAALTTAAFG